MRSQEMLPLLHSSMASKRVCPPDPCTCLDSGQINPLKVQYSQPVNMQASGDTEQKLQTIKLFEIAKPEEKKVECQTASLVEVSPKPVYAIKNDDLVVDKGPQNDSPVQERMTKILSLQTVNHRARLSPAQMQTFLKLKNSSFNLSTQASQDLNFSKEKLTKQSPKPVRLMEETEKGDANKLTSHVAQAKESPLKDQISQQQQGIVQRSVKREAPTPGVFQDLQTLPSTAHASDAPDVAIRNNENEKTWRTMERITKVMNFRQAAKPVKKRDTDTLVKSPSNQCHCLQLMQEQTSKDKEKDEKSEQKSDGKEASESHDKNQAGKSNQESLPETQQSQSKTKSQPDRRGGKGNIGSEAFMGELQTLPSHAVAAVLPDVATKDRDGQRSWTLRERQTKVLNFHKIRKQVQLQKKQLQALVILQKEMDEKNDFEANKLKELLGISQGSGIVDQPVKSKQESLAPDKTSASKSKAQSDDGKKSITSGALPENRQSPSKSKTQSDKGKSITSDELPESKRSQAKSKAESGKGRKSTTSDALPESKGSQPKSTAESDNKSKKTVTSDALPDSNRSQSKTKSQLDRRGGKGNIGSEAFMGELQTLPSHAVASVLPDVATKDRDGQRSWTLRERQTKVLNFHKMSRHVQLQKKQLKSLMILQKDMEEQEKADKRLLEARG